MKRPLGKRLTAWLLALALAVTLLPGLELTALAAEEGSAAGPPAVETADGLPVTDEPAEPPVTEEPAELPVTDAPAALPSPSLVQAAAGQEDSYVEIYRFFTKQNGWTDWTGTTLRDGYYIKSNQDYNSENKYPTYQANPGRFPDQYVLFFRDGVLYMNGYKGGPIGVTNAPDEGLEIQVRGNSYITVPSFVLHTDASGDPKFYSCIIMATKFDYSGNRTLTITSDTGKTLSLSGSTNSDSDHRKHTFLYGVYGGTLGKTNVRLMGDVTVDINLNHFETCGILANALEILDRASLNITQSADDCCFGPNVYTDTEMCYAVGIDAKTLTVNTTGSINMDLSKVQSEYSHLYSRGLRLRQFNGNRIPYMSIKWRPGGRDLGGPLYDRNDAVMEQPYNLVVQKQSDRCIYRTGTPVDFTLEDCKIREAWDSAGRELLTYGPFVAGDKLWLVQTRVPELPILYWQIGDYIGSRANWFFPELEVTDDRATIKPVFRLGEPGNPVFEWLNGSGGFVRHKLNSSQGLSGIKLLDGDNKAVPSTWTYDSEKQELTVAVESISPGEAYRLTAVKGSTLNPPKLYTEWFRVQSVQAPEVTTGEGYYYKSIELKVDVPERGKLYYKEGLRATINEWDKGTDYSKNPLILDGGNSNPDYWTMRVRQEDNDGNISWSIPTYVDTSVWKLWEDSTWGGKLPPPAMSVTPSGNFTHIAASSEYILTGPVDVNLHWSLPPSQWPMNARVRYTTDPDETDIRNFQYYTKPIRFDSSGGHLRIVTSARDAYGLLYYSDIATYNFIPGELPGGVTVSGTAVSWNGTDDAVYKLYLSTADDNTIKSEWKTGTYTTALAYTAAKGGMTQNADGKRYNQTFSFQDVTPGQYKLAIFKPGKYVPKIVPITVESTAVNLAEQKLWLYGDVTYDGKITTADGLAVYRKCAGVPSAFNLTTDPDILMAADINIDGRVTTADGTAIYRKVAGQTSAFDLILK